MSSMKKKSNKTKQNKKSRINKITRKITVLEEFTSIVYHSKIVWSIHGSDGWVVCDSILSENKSVIPFWSTEKAAEIHCVEEWKNYKPTPISLDEFIDFWLVELANDGLLFGIEWSDTLKGDEIASHTLEAEFLKK